MIFSVSSERAGINLRTIDIIIAKSCTGTLIFFKGESKDSIAYVSWMGVVVKDMNILDARIRQSILTAINSAFHIPSSYILIRLKAQSGSPSPLVRNTLIINVNIRINITALNDLSTILKGIFDIKTIKRLKSNRKVNEARLLQKKIATIKIVASKIFVLLSSLWITDPEG
jgi:hypothetical protein